MLPSTIQTAFSKLTIATMPALKQHRKFGPIKIQRTGQALSQLLQLGKFIRALVRHNRTWKIRLSPLVNISRISMVPILLGKNNHHTLEGGKLLPVRHQ